jgi:hypothetical protein
VQYVSLRLVARLTHDAYVSLAYLPSGRSAAHRENPTGISTSGWLLDETAANHENRWPHEGRGGGDGAAADAARERS